MVTTGGFRIVCTLDGIVKRGSLKESSGINLVQCDIQIILFCYKILGVHLFRFGLENITLKFAHF